MTARDRALGALYGLAVGDALGMPTQALPRDVVAQLFGDAGRLPGRAGGERAQRRPARGPHHRRHRPGRDRRRVPGRRAAGGWTRTCWPAGCWAGRTGWWPPGPPTCWGPRPCARCDLVAAGAPAGTTGRWGDTDGAAMRVAPLGVATPPEPLDRLCAAVADLDRLTHDTTVANAGACAVAAVVSAGVAGAGWDEAAALGLRAAAAGRPARQLRPGSRRRPPHPLGPGPGARHRRRHPAGPGRRAGRHRGGHPGGGARRVRDRLPGGRPTRGAPACWLPGSAVTATRSRRWRRPWSAPAPGSAALPATAVQQVRRVNGLDLEPLVDDLLRIRAAR